MEKKISAKLLKKALALILCLLFPVTSAVVIPVQVQAEEYTKKESAIVGGQEALAAAQRAIRAAMKNFPASNDTTEEEYFQAAKDALPAGSPVTLEIYEFKVIPATEEMDGRVHAVFVLKDGNSPSLAMPTEVVIPRITSQDEKKLEEDRLAISLAMKKVAVSNSTTKEELIKAGRAAVKNGTVIEWKSFRKVDATFEKKGSITGYLSVKLNGFEKEQRFHADIPKRERKMPVKQLTAKGRVLTSTEWEVLRQTNIERHKKGLSLLTMVQPLQGVTCVRAKEEDSASKPDHKRPDGSSFATAVPSSFKNAGLGENLFHCGTGIVIDATRAVNSWMNSKAHRENILKAKFHYIGVTVFDHMAVQVFAISKNKITSYSTSTGKKSFNSVDEMEEAYLVCRDSSGLKSYMPLDTSYMKKVKGGYTLKLNSKKTIKLTIKGSSTPAGGQFTDVDPEDAKAVKWVTDKKYMTGISKTEFGPKLSCTRGDVLIYLYRANGSPTPPSLNWFADVKSTDPFYKAALWAQQQGLVDWGMLRPNEVCLRGEAIYFVWMSAGSPKPKKKTTFTDFPEWVFYAEALAWAEEKGIVKNSGDNCFHGDDWPCSRADMAHYLYGAYHK